MIIVQQPGWLWLIPLLLVLLWWLQRYRKASAAIAVSSLDLWPQQQQPSQRRWLRWPDSLWMLRAALLCSLVTCLSNPGWQFAGALAPTDSGLHMLAPTLKLDYRSGHYQLTVRLQNTGNADTTAAITISSGEATTTRFDLAVAANSSAAQTVRLAAPPLAPITVGASNGALAITREIDASAGLPLPVRVDDRCGAALASTIRAHPGLQLAAAVRPKTLHITCGNAAELSQQPTLVLPAHGLPLTAIAAPVWLGGGTAAGLYLEPQWLNYQATTLLYSTDTPLLASNDKALLVRRGPNIISAVALQSGAITQQPVYPLLIAALLDQLSATDLKLGMVTAPAPAVKLEAPRLLSLGTPLLMLALGLLLVELARYRRA